MVTNTNRTNNRKYRYLIEVCSKFGDEAPPIVKYRAYSNTLQAARKTAIKGFKAGGTGVIIKKNGKYGYAEIGEVGKLVNKPGYIHGYAWFPQGWGLRNFYSLKTDGTLGRKYNKDKVKWDTIVEWYYSYDD